ncbi:hypothetical protein C351_00026 [Cryptococcus neoformans c8]|nr:hypothetical protein C353_00027 [Cryptococcus neoformans var. grubii AD1-83a]OXG69718.1 hypothetical protein C351_00026 [Cryptococcus neoformans var. grubii c8]OXG70870.1 hypothetical protein C354_00026 [Cryptococcus neoformans var. grubii MW-RSA1955]OXG74037.1 hypothetical protein C352_00026 [Cryptococcus neoformans var. grubii CHC193]OXH19987.1 hypothetical protein C369_00027 [Cryptococcus neoformans var. grubii A5-35-17]OXH20951.1 hypothetical protein C370_00025 [Cryptococcus neoformans 
MAFAELISSMLTRTPQPPPSTNTHARAIQSHSSKIFNTPDSDIVPTILYVDPSSTPSSHPTRGRTHSRTYEWYEAYQAEREKRRGSKGSTKSTSSDGSVRGRRRSDELEAVDAQTISSHHTLPSVVDEVKISPTPILYLPPLLSPLPERAHEYAHSRDRNHDYHEHSRVEVKEVVEFADSRQTLSESNGQVDPLRDFTTRLPHIDPASLALHQTLHHFKPLSNAYASLPYDKAFNWSSLNLPKSTEREWYCVVFRSRRKPESANLSLYKADREAHEEAVRNGGLIMYWYGVPDKTGLNLATCIWQSRRHAIRAISGPKHISAMKQTKGAYETYSLERWVLSTEVGSREIKLRKWEGGEVGW